MGRVGPLACEGFLACRTCVCVSGDGAVSYPSVGQCSVQW